MRIAESGTRNKRKSVYDRFRPKKRTKPFALAVLNFVEALPKDQFRIPHFAFRL